jgi:hypothetical protein
VVIGASQGTAHSAFAQARPNTRVYLHAQLAVCGLRDVGLSAAPSKVVVGDPLIALGLQLNREAGVIDCPDGKRAAIRADMAEQRAATVRGSVHRARAERLVGRLCNPAQIWPELAEHLHGGYALVKSRWGGGAGGGRVARPLTFGIGMGARAQRDWICLLDISEESLEANRGTPIAPQLTFPARSSQGALTVVTDASGVDGVGGYAFIADAPGHVWLTSEVWPQWAQAALHRSPGREGGRGGDGTHRPRCPDPRQVMGGTSHRDP